MMDAAKLTDMEKTAVKSARPFLAEALDRAGVMPAFAGLSGADIDAIILAVWEGCRTGMLNQHDNVPF